MNIDYQNRIYELFTFFHEYLESLSIEKTYCVRHDLNKVDSNKGYSNEGTDNHLNLVVFLLNLV